MARSRAWQEQLAIDLARPSPVYYRRLPSGSSFGTRHYYDPVTGRIVTEHYVVRVYRPALQQAERQLVRRRSIEQSVLDRGRKVQAAEVYAVKNNISVNDALRSNEFQQRWAELAVLRAQQRQLNGSLDISRLNQVLVDLGRRLGTEEFPPGDSPKGYIAAVVLPALRGE